MPTLLLIRHGRTAANTGGQLAGRTPGVLLDDLGQQQVAALAQRLAVVPLAAAVSSPLERCVATAEAVLAAQPSAPALQLDGRLSECDYGEWTGAAIKDLAKDPLWPAVQAHPSSVTFPGGETMRGMQQRAVDVVRATEAAVAASHGERAVWAAFSHGDVIKAILADALGMHLDAFQRLVVDPASVSVIRYTPLRPFAVRVNDSGVDLSVLVPPEPPPAAATEDEPDRSPVDPAAAAESAGSALAASDAVIGGGAGGGLVSGDAPVRSI